MSDIEVIVENQRLTALVVQETTDLVIEATVFEVVTEQDVTELVVEQTTLAELVVEVPGIQGPPGAAGAAGPAGPAGSSGEGKEFYFAVPLDRWEGVHNLGYTPAVGLYGTDGRAIRGLVTENGPVRTVVEYYFPVAGRMTTS